MYEDGKVYHPSSRRSDASSVTLEMQSSSVLEDHQDSLLSVEEKNRLWKLVLKKTTVYRTQDDELMIHIYPNLPQ